MTNEIEPQGVSTPGRIARAFGVVAEPLKRKAPLLPRLKSVGVGLRAHYLWALAPIGMFIGAIWAWLLFESLTEVWVLTEGIPSGNEDQNRNRIQAIFFGVGVIGALLAALVVPYRIWLQLRQTTTAEQGHITDRLTKAIEMLGAEKTKRYRVRSITYDLPAGDKMVAMETHQRPGEDPDPPIHSDAENVVYGEYETSEETIPNLEVRLGAIYALERIAQDSERDHITVMETLCAYIRENAPASMAQDHDLGEWPDWPEDADEQTHNARDAKLKEREQDRKAWIMGLAAPRVDIQAAATVIGRRSDERVAFERRQRQSDRDDDPGFQLDLRKTCLQRADLSRAKLDRALLTGARLDGAGLREANLENSKLGLTSLERAHFSKGSEPQGASRMDGADLGLARLKKAVLGGVSMEGANLRMARMQGSKLSMVRMEDANLSLARLDNANVDRARMEGAYLREVRMEGADLSEARMERANLREARMDKANLCEARMERADFSGARMEGAHLDAALMEDANLFLARFQFADLRDWNIARTYLRYADFSDAMNLSQDAVNSAFGDVETKLPEGITLPDHWDEEVLLDGPDKKYEAWLDAGAPPGKPKVDT
ncbi:MAG: pentapeptide repeat-containing protein [Pseudomonadota bacterium]